MGLRRAANSKRPDLAQAAIPEERKFAIASRGRQHARSRALPGTPRLAKPAAAKAKLAASVAIAPNGNGTAPREQPVLLRNESRALT
jgi:hypothetical protein